MTNSYYKVLNNQIKSGYKKEFIHGLQQDLRKSVNEVEDLYSEIVNLDSAKGRDLDINLLLKYYMLNQIMAGNSNKIGVALNDTKNPNIKIDKHGKYYRLVENELKKDENIKTVNEDGSYVVYEKRHSDTFKVVKSYDIDDQIISIKIVDNNGKVSSNKDLAAKLIGLRKEFKKKYKYSGYSGNSIDMLATILNMFSTPIETGFYMDFHCFFYKWKPLISSFERIFSRDADSPYLVDIEFKDNGTVLRQEYTGIVF